MDHDVTRRRFLILQALASATSGVTVRQLADEHGVNLKTIRRDLTELKSFGCGVEESVGKQNLKTWRIPAAPAGLANLKFNYLETLALFLSHRLLDPLADTFLWKDSRSALRKLRAHLDPATLKLLDRIASRFHFTSGGHGSYSAQSELIDRIQIAVEDSLVTQLLYHPLRARRPEAYEIHPLGYANHHGVLYLVSWVPSRSAYRNFKVDRMRQADLGTQKFQPPADFNLADHFKGSFGVYVEPGDQEHLVRVRFTSTPVVRHIQESTFHPSQTLTQISENTVTLEIRLTSLKEVKSWILSFGPHAQALAPPELVQQIQSDVTRMAAAYGHAAAPRVGKRTGRTA